MGEKNWKDWRPFVYGGLASIVAELCKQIIISDIINCIFLVTLV